MSDHFDRQGKPMEFMEWAAAIEAGDRSIGRDDVGEAAVSTVWVGLNYQMGEGPPLIFETMIFGGPHSDSEWRYATEAAARAGHLAVVQALRDGTAPPTDLPIT